MFIGHGMLAFAVVALVARWMGWSRDRALLVGLVAGAFGFAPDVDILYALVGLVSEASTPFARAENFWTASTAVHRTVTHSLFVGSGAAIAATMWSRSDVPSRTGAVTLVGGLVLGVFLISGGLAAMITLAFGVVVLGIASVAARFGLPPLSVLGAALFGLLTHPFGDLFTGTPPQFLYPFDMTLIGERLSLSPEPTLHLLGAMGIELATIWLAALVFCSLTGQQLRQHIEPWAVLGVGYIGAVLAIPPPTLETSYQFVFSILAVGAGSATPRLVPRRVDWLAAGVTALAAITVGALVYTVAYVTVL